MGKHPCPLAGTCSCDCDECRGKRPGHYWDHVAGCHFNCIPVIPGLNLAGIRRPDAWL